MTPSVLDDSFDDVRGRVLRTIGANEAEAAELLAYGQQSFDGAAVAAGREYPLSDEPFVDAWLEYERESKTVGVAECLRRRLVQLQFPIDAGTSQRDDYRAATRRGVLPTDGADGAHFVCPEGLQLLLHATPAGRLPVIIASAREDFETLVRALTRRNEPDAIPASMGACIVAGYNNCDRIARLRTAWEASHEAAEWGAELERIVRTPALYQDRFVVLSSGPYSATSASAVNLDEESWIRASLTIRLEHECAHYFTRRVFGSMRNSLLDELIADYAGIVTAAGRFRGDWLVRFMGLEAYPSYRAGGRLQNYRGTPPLSEGAFIVLQTLLVEAVKHLERFDASLDQRARRESMTHRAHVITAMARVGLERMASSDGDALLRRELESVTSVTHISDR